MLGGRIQEKVALKQSNDKVKSTKQKEDGREKDLKMLKSISINS